MPLKKCISYIVKITWFNLLFIFIIYACTSRVDIDFQDFEDHYIVNSIIVSDSPFRVCLTKSMRSNSEESFSFIDRALVKVSDGENSFLLSYVGEGIFQNDTFPHYGTEYILNIKLDNGLVLKAKTYSPEKPKINIIPSVKEDLVNVKLNDNLIERNTYWVGIKTYSITNERYYYDPYIYLDCLLFDDFNRRRTGEVKHGIIYSYHFMARLTDESFDGVISFNVPRSWPDSYNDIDYKMILYIINADEHLDQYMKSALIQYDLGVIGDMPVFHTPVDMYSNIENGKGIFGSYTISQFDITTPESIYQNNETGNTK